MPKYCTIGDFFSNIITIGSKHYCEDELRIIYLKDALEKIDASVLGIDSQLNSLLKQSEYLFRFFAELTHENKTIEQLYEYDTYTFYHDHLDKLQAVFDEYVNILRSNNAVDKITLPFEYELHEEYLSQFESIWIYYEGYFSSFEFDLLNKIKENTQVKIHYSQTQFNPKNIKLFQNIGLDLEIGNHYVIDLLEQTIIEQNPIEENDSNIIIEKCSQRMAQIGFIKYQITQMVQKGIDPDTIVVVLPDESYHEYLQLHNREKYFNFAMGNSISNSKLLQVLEAMYKILIDFEPYDKDKIVKYELDEKCLFDTLKIQMNKMVQKDTFEQIIEYILQYESRNEVIQKIQLMLLKLDKLIFSSNIQVTLKETLKILIQRLKQITIDDVMGGKITVMGLLETRLLNPQGVIIIDFNDHIIPKRSIKDKFISTQIKEHVGLPTSKHREDLQKYYYDRLLSYAKEIAISYVDDEQSGLSRFAYELFDRETIQEQQSKKYEEILLQTKEYKSNNDQIILPIDLSTKVWSATALKTYLQCKRKYYYQYIAQIKEHYASIKPQGFELGDILHKSLYQLYLQKPLNLTQEQFTQNLYSLIDQYSHKNPYLLLDIEIWKRKLKKFIDVEYKRFESGIFPVGLEQSFQLTHNGIRLKGVIDRIDKNLENITVLDYKTSSSLKIDNEKNYMDSVDFQLEFYYLAAKEEYSNEMISCYYYDLNNAKIKEEIMLDQKVVLLDSIFEGLHKSEVNFEKCEEKKTCEFCIYKVMCGR